MRRKFWWSLGALAITLVSGGSASALPVTPTARSCVVDPIERIELQDAAKAPVPRRAEPAISATPVTDIELGGISRIVRIMTACTNANQPLRALALVTDTYIADYFAGPAGQDQLGHLLAASSRDPVPAARKDRLALIAVEDPARYEDGRIAVTVVTQNAESRFTDLLIFTETDNGWRLDQVMLGEVEPTTATPVP
jgi:hypothetical protein